MKWIYRIVCVVLVAVMLVSAWKIWEIMAEYKEGENTYSEMEKYIDIPSPTPAPSDPGEDDGSKFPVVDFASLQQINPDVVGWIYIPGTHVNYPVVQGSDNDYYLNRLFNHKWNSAGSIFMDYRNDPNFADLHTIVYGHQMNNKTMFNDLKLYRDQEFYNQQPVGYFLTPDATYLLEFFSGYVSSVETNAWDMEFTQNSYGQWLEDLKSRSEFTSAIQPQTDSRVVTLSTCSTDFENARYVLHAILRPAAAPQ